MTDRDNITLPREVVQEALEALEYAERHHGGDDCYAESAAALRTALAALRLEVTIDPRLTPEEAAAISAALTAPKQEQAYFDPQKRKFYCPRPTRTDAPTIVDVPPLPLYTAPPEDKTHPGYIIGSHWLETAYSRVCAGEAEADVLRDMGWERVDEALRRDAERYRWLRNRAWFQFEFEGRYGDSGETVQELDAAIDAAMGEKR